MSQWNFNTPYRLLDGRTACGLQVVVDDAVATYAVIPEIWKQIDEWKENTSCSIDECSLELVGIRIKMGNRHVLRWALILRFAAVEDCDHFALSVTASELKGYLGEFFAEAGIVFRDVEDNDGVLAHFPIWDAGTANNFCSGSFAKKAETIAAESAPLTWFRELQPDREIDIPSILQVMGKHVHCGLSLEIHAMPGSVCSKAEGCRVQDADCKQWLKKIEDGNVVSTRLMYWGNGDFAKAIKKAVNKRLPTLDQEELEYTCELSNYMVYDPWAYMNELILQTANTLRLGAAKYALTLDEMQRLCAPGKEMEQTELEKEGMPQGRLQIQATGQTQPVPAQPADQTGFAQKVAEVVVEKLGGRIDLSTKAAEEAARLVRENNEQLESNTKQLKQNTEAVEKTGEEIRQNTQVLRQIITDIGEMSGKMDKLAELAEICEKIVPAGCEIAFTADELKWLGIENEEELCSKYGIEESAVRLLKTALTLARLGMKMDENDTAFMAFSTPLGTFYEYMMRRYFAPGLYQHVLPVPPKKRDEVPPKPKKSPDLVDFDSIIQWCTWPYRNYEEHVQIEGEKRTDLYWLAWLNIMKPVREIRNKVHPERGEASKEELKMLYEVLLKPGIKPKVEVLKYGKGKKILFLCKSDGTWWDPNRFFEKMNSNMEWFTPSLFHFILKCGKAEWV